MKTHRQLPHKHLKAVRGIERSPPQGKSKSQGKQLLATGQERSLLPSATWLTSQRDAGSLEPFCVRGCQVLKCQKNFIVFKGLEGLEEDQHFPLTFLHDLKEVETLLSSNTSAEEDNPTHMSPSYMLNT